MVFTFDNILLPDSTTNEPGSHGFVKLRIEQAAGNQAGDVIYNSAAIYFDFNDPVITNISEHRIGNDFIEVDIIDGYDEVVSGIILQIFPHPFTESTVFNIEGYQFHQLEIELFDVTGRPVLRERHYGNRFTLHRKSLINGIYSFQISTEDGLLITNGKLIIQ